MLWLGLALWLRLALGYRVDVRVRVRVNQLLGYDYRQSKFRVWPIIRARVKLGLGLGL